LTVKRHVRLQFGTTWGFVFFSLFFFFPFFFVRHMVVECPFSCKAHTCPSSALPPPADAGCPAFLANLAQTEACPGDQTCSVSGSGVASCACPSPKVPWDRQVFHLCR